MLHGQRLGRGIVDESRPATPAELPVSLGAFPEQRRGATRRVPRSLPGPGVVFGATIAAASSARWHLSRSAGGELLPLATALCPLDRADVWPAAFGRGGLVQYQFAVPAGGTAAFRRVLEVLARRRMSPRWSS